MQKLCRSADPCKSHTHNDIVRIQEYLLFMLEYSQFCALYATVMYMYMWTLTLSVYARMYYVWSSQTLCGICCNTLA